MANQHDDSAAPFANDLLNRKPAAEFLSKYLVGRHRVSKSVPEYESFVLNLNAEWGLGKTYFLTEWAKMLRLSGHPVVYFDAWENDYVQNPFIGFVMEIQKQLTEGLVGDLRVKDKIRKLVEQGKKIISATAPTIALGVVKHWTGFDGKHVVDAIKDSAIDAAGNIKRDIFKETLDVRAARESFKKSLREVALAVRESKPEGVPIFLLIDELDRCRPTYAIELLENIKHIFRVADVYTVVATDSEQLAHSIRAIYGSGFDSQRYLRRFFDHESRLETPDLLQIARHMLSKRDLMRADAFDNPLASELGAEANAVLVSRLGQALKLTVRDFQRAVDIVDSIRLSQSQDGNASVLEILLLGFTTMLYVAHSTAFSTLRSTHSGAKVLVDLKGRYDPEITIRYQMSQSGGGFSPSDMDLVKFCCLYIGVLWSDNANLAAPEGNHTLYQMELTFRHKYPVITKLRSYERMVSDAGSFSF